jgi:hypothetical protein
MGSPSCQKAGSCTSARCFIGLGLQSASERLRRLFGPQATLELDLSQQQRALARIRIQQSEAGRQVTLSS